VRAGVTITGADGITVTGSDGITYVRTSGITVTGADNFLGLNVNGITTLNADGITVTGADGISVTGADGYTSTGSNNVIAQQPDGITVTGADGITVTGADGITVTGADGTSYRADSVTVRRPSGITVTGADGLRAVGANGITRQSTDGISLTGADGITVTGADGITVTGADGITVTGADGQVFNVSPNGITVTGADQLAAITRATGITVTGADGITVTGADAYNSVGTGLRSIDPELAARFNLLTDDSNINAVVVYHQLPTSSDLAQLQSLGINGGTRYHALPMIVLTATRSQLVSVSRLPTVRSIYSNRTLQSTFDSRLAMTGVERVRRDADLTRSNSGLAMTGRGVTVAVLDTGLDGTHSDLAGRVVQNVKLADAQSASVGFNYPLAVENLQDTDQAYGHGTFVAGLIAGNGSKANGLYNGMAPNARVVGLSAGDLTLSFVLAGFDYLLDRGAGLNTRVVNCSFSANTVFDFNDPVNVATKMLFDSGVNVVFSAGNNGPGLHSLNPYAVAPWVVSVGATDEKGGLASFSSRGDFGSALFHPTLVAPGVGLVSLRATGVNVTGTESLADTDSQRLSATELPYYTTATGTSFSAPQVAGIIALMLEANPNLTPTAVRDILQRTATPLPNYYSHEVGAGMLNAHAAVLEAMFPARRMGLFRATLDRGQASFINEPVQQMNGIVNAGGTLDELLMIPENTLLASVQTAWGPVSSLNDLSLALTDPNGRSVNAATSNQAGLTGKRERLALNSPAPGAYQARVTNALGNAGTAQPASVAFEITRVQYGALSDINNLASSTRAEISQALRNFALTPYGARFRPAFTVSRLDLATALVLGARVPQYLPAQSRYTDVRDSSSMLFVESVQAAPCGALLIDAPAGGSFRPDERVSRLTATVALVRAAGLRAEAEAKAGWPLSYTDSLAIPSELRGYVYVAVQRGLMTTSGASFNPQGALTRAELAHALATIQRIAAS
jgi:serine protease AprX